MGKFDEPPVIRGEKKKRVHQWKECNGIIDPDPGSFKRIIAETKINFIHRNLTTKEFSSFWSKGYNLSKWKQLNL